MKSTFKRVIFDIETNGLLEEQGARGIFAMNKIHCLVIMDIDTGEIIDYVNDGVENDLEEGVRILMEADLLVGHNILDFDIPAIRLIYPWFEPPGRIIDTLVMVRMCFADVKEKDFRLAAKKQLEGKLIGLQGLEAWGQRLQRHKGDYKKDRENALKQIHKDKGIEPPTVEELHVYVWGTWNEEMHDYCVNDVEVNKEVWDKVDATNWSHEATVMEHHIHALMIQQERNGFYFDLERAEKLAVQLQDEYDRFTSEATDAIGIWYRPARWIKDEEQFQGEYGETKTRKAWGRVDIPKRSISYAKANKKMMDAGDYSKLRASTVEGCPVVKVELREFNPNSRPQIEDRLCHLYGWTPQDFTETGQAKIDDEILRNLSEHIPLAETLAEIFYYKKRIGMVVDGKNGWLKLVREDQRIHGRVNVGGTVSGRATHASPNISQVPGVNALEPEGYDNGKQVAERHELAGTLVSAKYKEAKDEWKIVVRGREGDHGWDCRELFTVPDGYKLVGCDLSGIEFRCLANLTYQFDGGELINLVLNGDVHQRNADLAGISRSVAKRLLYATMYGGGLAKLGSIVEPLSNEARQMALGKTLKAKLMHAMPSLNQAIKAIHTEMRQNGGKIRGLDDRWLYARSKHSALNLRLQSDGALIAKKWCLLTDDMFWDEGWDHGVGLDYAFCSWSHDEIQVAVRNELADRAAEIMEAAAPLAGEHFRFKCPVAAEAVIGTNWAETH